MLLPISIFLAPNYVTVLSFPSVCVCVCVLCSGIEWTGQTSFASFAYTNSHNSAGLVRSEVAFTDMQTGEPEHKLILSANSGSTLESTYK